MQTKKRKKLQEWGSGRPTVGQISRESRNRKRRREERSIDVFESNKTNNKILKFEIKINIKPEIKMYSNI